MEIDQLISIVKEKLKKNILIENLLIEDKTFLHKKHINFQKGKYHLKVSINSDELNKYGKINATKKIYKILDEELKSCIHSIQILIN